MICVEIGLGMSWTDVVMIIEIEIKESYMIGIKKYDCGDTPDVTLSCLH